MEGLSKEELLYDERAERLRQIRAQRQRKMRKRRHIRNFFLLALLAGIVLYFVSDLSKVHSLSVRGNFFYSDEEIYARAGVSYETRYLLKPAFLMESGLQNDELIDSVEIQKDLSGVIHIEVKEKLIVGYLIKEDRYYLLTSEGNQVEVDEGQQASARRFPLLSGFDEDQLSALACGIYCRYASLHSENARTYQTSFNENMMRVVMRDGNTLYGSYEAAGVLQIYESVLAKLQGNNVCLYMDEENGAMSKISCSEFQDEDASSKEK